MSACPIQVLSAVTAGPCAAGMASASARGPIPTGQTASIFLIAR